MSDVGGGSDSTVPDGRDGTDTTPPVDGRGGEVANDATDSGMRIDVSTDVARDSRDGGPGAPDGVSPDGVSPDAPPPQAVLSISPPTGSFGQVVANGTSATIGFKVTNGGTGVSSPLSATLSGTNAAQFQIVGGDCAQASLPAGGSCTVDVQFRPTQIGSFGAELVIAGANPLSAMISGEGVAPSALSSSPPAGNFNGVPISGATTYADITFTITNTGAVTSGALATAISGTDASTFAIRADNCAGMALGAMMSCTLAVRFTPGTRGAKVGSLTVQGMPGGVLPVNLAGRGDAPAGFTILPATTNLPSAVDVGQTGAVTNLTVANAGDLPGTVTPTSSDTTNFTVTNGCSGMTVPAGQTCTVGVRLAPTSAGAKTTTVTVAPGVTGQNSAVINGTGRDQLPLTVIVAGNGTGTVTAAAGVEGNGINCPGDCSENYHRTTSNPIVTLTANYNPLAANVTWSAPCAGSTSTCDVTLSAATSVTVTFAMRQYTLTVTRSAEATGATGTVTGTGINCGSTCSATVSYGATVTLTASPSAGFYFSAWSGGGCSGGALQCTTTAISADTTIDAKFTLPNVIFVTSQSYSPSQFATYDPMGQMDPLRGADRYCRERAAAGSAPTMANRTFNSIITVGNAEISTRLGGKRGWVRADGKPFGDDFASIQSANKIFYPPALDENGAVVNDAAAHATLGTGCMNWTSTATADYRTAGVPTGGGGAWNSAFGYPCDRATHLYCMSVDYTATVTAPPPTAGRIAFLTDGLFVPSGSTGLAAADAFCQTEANASSLPGTYVAMMAAFSPQTTAYGRLTATGTRWVRPDGIPIVNAPTDLNTAAPSLLATIQVSPRLTYYGAVAVWTGAASALAAGVAATSCTPSGGTSWTAGNVMGIAGGTGDPSFTAGGFLQDFYDAPCTSGMHLYCFQQ